jgi:aquaporin Z
VQKLWQQALAEVIGTFALVFIGAGSVAILTLAIPQSALIGVALAHGLVLAIMVSNLGHISGAHFNPAVTISVWVVGKIESARAGAYILAQLVGGALGALLLRWLLPVEIWKQTSLGATLVSEQAKAAGVNTGKAIGIEAVLTFFLAFTVFAVAVDDRGVFKTVAGLTIGLVLTMDILMGGLFTGASMNPARSFGPALVAGKWTDFWIYLVGPITGAILGGAVYWFAYLREREVSSPRTETPIGGGPEEDLPFDSEDPLP